jgi:hypothetical protein
LGARDSLLGDADSHGYRRRLPEFSTNDAAASANDPRWESFSDAPALTYRMDRNLAETGTRRLPDLGIAVKSIIGFWVLYIALITLRAVVLQ